MHVCVRGCVYVCVSDYAKLTAPEITSDLSSARPQIEIPKCTGRTPEWNRARSRITFSNCPDIPSMTF